jgi:hypothetical protein
MSDPCPPRQGDCAHHVTWDAHYFNVRYLQAGMNIKTQYETENLLIREL